MWGGGFNIWPAGEVLAPFPTSPGVGFPEVRVSAHNMWNVEQTTKNQRWSFVLSWKLNNKVGDALNCCSPAEMQYLWDFVGLEEDLVHSKPEDFSSLRHWKSWLSFVPQKYQPNILEHLSCLLITNILLLTYVGTSLEVVTTVKSPSLVIIEDQPGFEMDREGAAGKLLTGVSVEYRYWIKRWCWRWKPAKSELVYLGQKAAVHCVTSERLLPCNLFGSQSTFSCLWILLTNKIFCKCFQKTNPTFTNGNNKDSNEDDAQCKMYAINQEMHYILWI